MRSFTCNTNIKIHSDQLGRTFQDRTHVFKIKEPKIDGKIFDLSVSGKRGNAAQVYPSLPSRLVPSSLEIDKNSHLNIHWTGSRLNNNGNDGRGDGVSMRPDMPRKVDFHAISQFSRDNQPCLTFEGDLSEVSTSKAPSMSQLNSSCVLVDWQHGFG